MSAFIVSRYHIHQLVSAIDTYVSPTEEPSSLGQMLWDENIASVQYRYNNVPLKDLPGPCDETYVYAYETPQRKLSPIEAYKAARCFDYQSCEHDAWETSQAYDHIQTLCRTIEVQLGKTYDEINALPEYDKADWEICDAEPRIPTPPTEKKPVQQISLLDTAKVVRKALKAAYPTVKFSVRCNTYAGGCSIDVGWTDGPTDSQVQQICRQFNGKRFDGMTDMASSIAQEYEGEVVRFGADYVQSQRRISTAFMTQIACKVAAQYRVIAPEVRNSGSAKSGTDHGYVPSTPESNVRIPNAPPFGREERLLDVIHHVAHQTSALPKPRIRVMPIVRTVSNT